MLVCITSVSETTSPLQRPKPGPYRNGILLILTTVLVISILQVEKCRNPGKVPIPDLSPERLEKFLREMKEFDNVEQYVLLADHSGLYPCFNCPNVSFIFLNRGEVWRYGITRKGEYGRYGNTLKALQLVYLTQFEGSLQACYIEEKRKIYGYYQHPENLRRSFRLIRPPGNKQDR